MAEARLKIKPTLTGGNYKGGLSKIRNDVKSLAKQQGTALRAAVTDVKNLERGYYAAGRAASSLGRGASSLLGTMTGIKGIVTGLVAGTAGKTFLELTIGADQKVKRSRALLKAVIKDQDKVLKAERAAKQLVQEVSSLDFSSALGGIEKTFNLAGGNLTQAKELVKVAKALEQLDPSQGFEGALFALKELEGGDTMSLRSRFNIRLPTRAEAEKQAKKAGMTLQNFYFDKLTGFVDKRFGDEKKKGSGIDALLRIDREGLGGQVKMIQTSLADLFRSIGSQASNVASDEIGGLKKAIDDLQADPGFKRDVEDLTKMFASATKEAFNLAKQLPAGLKAAKEFASQYGTELKLIAGFLVANKLTGGAVGRVGGSMVAKAGGSLGRAIFGKRGGGIAGAAAGLAGVPGGATPVYVVNMGGGMPGGGGAGDFLKNNTKKFAGAGGLVGKLGAAGAAGAVGAGALIVGSAAAGAVTFYKVVNDTHAVVKKYEDRAKEAQARAKEHEKARAKAIRERAQALGRRNKLEAASPHLRNRRLLGKQIEGLGVYAGLGRGKELRASVNRLFGGGDQVFRGTKGQKFMLAELNKELARSGQRLSLKRGQTVAQARMTGGVDVFASANQQDADTRRSAQEYTKFFKRDANGRLVPKNAQAAAAIKRAEGSKGFATLQRLSASLQQRSRQASATAMDFNTSRGNVQLPKMADKFEFHFHGIDDSEAAQRSAKTVNESMDKLLARVMRHESVRNGG